MIPNMKITRGNDNEGVIFRCSRFYPGPLQTFDSFYLRLVVAKMDECLKKAAEGRKLSISLGNLAYSGEVSQQLLQFSEKMEKVYRNLQALGEDKFQDTKLVQKNVAIINDKLEWFTKAEARFQNVAFQPFQGFYFINRNSWFQ